METDEQILPELENCIICLDPITESTWIDLTEICCNIRIHLHCLEENRRRLGRKCPHCRSAIYKRQLDKVDITIPEMDSINPDLDASTSRDTVPINNIPEQQENLVAPLNEAGDVRNYINRLREERENMEANEVDEAGDTHYQPPSLNEAITHLLQQAADLREQRRNLALEIDEFLANVNFLPPNMDNFNPELMRDLINEHGELWDLEDTHEFDNYSMTDLVNERERLVAELRDLDNTENDQIEVDEAIIAGPLNHNTNADIPEVNSNATTIEDELEIPDFENENLDTDSDETTVIDVSDSEVEILSNTTRDSRELEWEIFEALNASSEESPMTNDQDDPNWNHIV